MAAHFVMARTLRRSPFSSRARPFGWIKRRARMLQTAFHVARREAIQSAADDFAAFNLPSVK